jgi:pimeloyl-ACP methyl ester carboxylesterase
LGLPGGEVVIAWLSPARADAGVQRFLIALHGNGENLETLKRVGLPRDLEALGPRVLVLDYPGYGRSSGTPSEAANTQAVLAAMQWIQRREPEAKFVLWGWSLGAAVALQAARALPADASEALEGMVLLSPWTRLKAAAAEHYPRWLVAVLAREDYDSLAAAQGLRVPALVLHGSADSLIPAEQGRQVAAALGAAFQEIPGAGHNDLLDHESTWQAMKAFLAP